MFWGQELKQLGKGISGAWYKGKGPRATGLGLCLVTPATPNSAFRLCVQPSVLCMSVACTGPNVRLQTSSLLRQATFLALVLFLPACPCPEGDCGNTLQEALAVT